VWFTLIINKREVPGSKDHKERVNNEDEDPADVRDKRQDTGNDRIDEHSNDKPDEEDDIRQPSYGPDRRKDR